MAIKFMRVKRMVLSVLTVALIASQLAGCAVLQKNELLDMISQGDTVTIEMTVPNWTPASAQQLADLSWVQLDQLTAYSSTGFRGSIDTIFNINTVTTQSGNSKQGCMYVVSENGAEHQSGNTSLRDAFRNKAFMNYWNDSKVQNAIAEAVEFAYTDIDATSQYATFAALNAYYNLFNDGDNDDTYGATQSLTREQFMTLMFKAGNGVKELGDYSVFASKVGTENYYTKYAAQVADHSYLKTTNGSLSGSNISTPISKLEVVYMLVDTYLKPEVDKLLAGDSKISAFGYRDAGDQITDLDINAEGTSEAVENNLLAYLVDTQGEKGIDHTLMAYLKVAEDNGLANGVTLKGDLFTSVTKDEALRLITNTYQAENKLYGYLTTGEYAEMQTVEGDGLLNKDETTGNYEDLFEGIYQSFLGTCETDEQQFESEKSMVNIYVEDSTLPENGLDLYTTWRLENHPIQTTVEETPAPEVEAQPEVQLFTDCNETVYATTTVNVRDTYSTSGNKVGSLTKAQSVKRTGTGQGEAAGWSRIEFNGQVAYVNSDYLSTTKPQVSTSSGSGGSSSNSGSTQTSKPSTSKPSTSKPSNSNGSSTGNTGKPFDDTPGLVQGSPFLDEDDLGDPTKGNNDDSNVGGYYNPSTGEFYYELPEGAEVAD